LRSSFLEIEMISKVTRPIAAAGYLLVKRLLSPTWRLSIRSCCAQAAGDAVPGPTDDYIDSRRLAELESRLERTCQWLRLPGFATGIVRDRELWWFKGYGFANLEARAPVTKDTPFHLASLTKPFASTILMRLVEQGKLDLDAPVSEFGIDLESPGTVTVRHLFSHTSRGNPGERYRYDGARFGLLDQVIEKITGQSFKANVADTVIQPLGLKNTGAMADELATKLASPYVLDESDNLVPGAYPTHFGASAGLVSSVSDYAEFIAAIRENQFLTAQTQAVAFNPAKSTSGIALPYGLGWFVENVGGTKVLWHYGYWDCVSTFVLMVPERNIAFLAFANSDGLSSGFGIDRGSVLRSPVALDFLDVFITESNEKFDRDVR